MDKEIIAFKILFYLPVVVAVGAPDVLLGEGAAGPPVPVLPAGPRTPPVPRGAPTALLGSSPAGRKYESILGCHFLIQKCRISRAQKLEIQYFS